MKKVKIKLSVIFSMLPIAAFAQSYLPVQDAYVVPGSPSNFGAAPNITVGSSSSTGLVQFDLSVLPAGTLASQVQKATLTLYVNHVSASGSMNVFTANGSWTELTVNGVNAPAPGTALATNIPIAVNGQFISLDVTPAVQACLSQASNNDGFLIQSNGGAGFQMDSKEATSTSHAAMLSITLTSSGLQGTTGSTGPQGPIGATGATGSQGVAGATGPQGPIGATGATGSQGIAGGTGPQGLIGATGATGSRGSTGATGPQGQIGTTGATGSQGVAGARGATGLTGAQGPAGVSGYQVVSNSFTIPAHFAYQSATGCPTGKVVWSGGLSFSLSGLTTSDIENIQIQQSYPSGTTAWTVVLINNTAKSLAAVGYAVCSN